LHIVYVYRLRLILHTLVIFSFILLLPPPRSTLFPYTTLFRSGQFPESGNRGGLLVGAVQDPLGDEHRHAPATWGRAAFYRLLYRSEEHTSELQSPDHLVCRLLLEKKKKNQYINYYT